MNGPRVNDASTIAPRGLTREAAATYCGLSLSGFDAWVSKDILPGPIPGTRRWDRKAIDLALDDLSKIKHNPPSPYDRWKARGCTPD